MPHRTTNHGGRKGGPWLVSMVMWFNCMRFVTDETISVGELERRARTTTNLNGMERWRYVAIEPGAEARRKTRRSEWHIRATAWGSAAREVWSGQFDIIEERWSKRFGPESIEQLRHALENVVSRLGLQLPDCLPILGYGLSCKTPNQKDHTAEDPNKDKIPLVALFAKVLLAFAIEFERESALSLAISANVLRILNQAGVRVRDLPVLSGVSKEAIAMALGILEKRQFAVVQADAAGSRTKAVRLTPKGSEVQEASRKLLAAIEERWKLRFGQGAMEELRTALERVTGEGERSRLFEGLEPYPEGWRAQVRRPEVLPHFPMVLHRGGFPDGS